MINEIVNCNQNLAKTLLILVYSLTMDPFKSDLSIKPEV